MSKFYKTKEVEELLKISNMTLQRWRNSGKIPYIKVSERKFLYKKEDIDSLVNENSELSVERKIAVYCRVSTTKQKEDLIRQKQVIIDYCNSIGIIPEEFYLEIASGMNDNRTELNKLIDKIMNYEISKVFITYKDRLTRFGFDYFRRLFSKYDCEIIILNNPVNEESMEQELTEDLISIIHHFSMKMYSNRRKKLKSFVKELGDSSE